MKPSHWAEVFKMEQAPTNFTQRMDFEAMLLLPTTCRRRLAEGSGGGEVFEDDG